MVVDSSDKNISKVREIVKNKLLNRDYMFDGYPKERQQVFELLKATVDEGESNSALLIGPRGSGKTTLINNVLKELEESSEFAANTCVVRLHGLVHTDDRLALKSATSQMCLENAVDGKVFGSFAENLAYLLACLRTGERKKSKSVIFVLEEFELFCLHHNQTLLYNLFDISQSPQTTICVLGTTCRLDVFEILEKRVKSRFSHRQIFLFMRLKHTPADLEEWLKTIEYYLSVGKNVKGLPVSFRKQWNKSVSDLIACKKFKEVVERLLDIDTNEQTLKNMLFVCVSKLSDKKTHLTAEDFREELNQIEKDDLLQVLSDLSVLELCLIISMMHHVNIYDNELMNFEMIYTRYLKFASLHSTVQSVERSVVMKAFEHIQSLELISMVNGRSGRLQNEYQMFKPLITNTQILEVIKKSHGLPTEVVQWTNSSFV